MNRFQVKLGHLSNYIRNFSPIKSIAIMERIVNHPILTIPQEGEHTFLFNGKPVTGMKGFTIAAALHQAGYPVHSHSVNGRNRSLNCGIGKCGACEMLVDGEVKRICITKCRQCKGSIGNNSTELYERFPNRTQRRTGRDLSNRCGHHWCRPRWISL